MQEKTSNETSDESTDKDRKAISRRQFVKVTGASGLAVGGTGVGGATKTGENTHHRATSTTENVGEVYNSPNTVYIDIDTLRPDHVGAYGYEAPTTPNIDMLAQDAVVFERAYGANSPCMPSRAALLTGRYGLNNGIVTHGPSAQTINSPHTWEDWNGDEEDAEEYWTLPELFFNHRIPTYAVSSFPRHPASWFYHLWDEYYQPREPDGAEEYFQTVRAETVADMTIDLLPEDNSSGFLLYSQFWDPHGPLLRPDEEVERFSDISLPPYPTDEQITAHQEWDTWHSAKEMEIADRDDLQKMIAAYDAEIRYVDHHVGRVIEALKQNEIYDDSLIIVTGDHGEEFGEHGVYQEHWSTYDGTQRVPLIIKPPAESGYEPGTTDALVTNVDHAPTIAEYAGLEMPARWQGQSLKPLLHDRTADWRDYIVVNHGLYTVQRAIRTDQWKLIRSYHEGLWDGILAEYELYDMETDPWEQTNLADSHPDLVEKLKQKMTQWAEEHVGRDEDALRESAQVGDEQRGYEMFTDEQYEGLDEGYNGVGADQEDK
jgi:arylsulfatase A-like enzyme